MVTKKMLSIVLGVLITVSMFAGCGDNKEQKPAQTSTEEISGTINYAFWGSGQRPYIEKCVEEFNKQYPQITINLEPSTFKEYWTKLETSMTGGSSADVFWMNGPNITKYAKGGVLMPIDDLIQSAGIDMTNYPEALVKLYNIDGVQYAIPKDFDTIGVWYNKKIFDDAGVPYPKDDWTWEDMVETAKKLTKSDKSVYGIGAGYRDQTGIYNTIFATNGYVISEDKKKSGYDQPETQAGIQLWIDMMKAGISPELASIEETEEDVQFLSGRLAMHWGGSWFLNKVLQSEIKDQIGVVALPSINGKKATVIHGLGNCIAKSTKNPEAAKKWVEFLATKKANQFSAETGAAIPAFKGTAKDWVEKNPTYDLKLFITAAEEYAYPYPASKNTGEWLKYQTEFMKKAFNNEMSVKEACDQLAEKMNTVLKEEN